MSGQAAGRLQVAMDASGMGRWDWDTSTGLVEWDVAHAQLFGVALEDFDGTVAGVLTCVHPLDRERVTADLLGAVRDSAAFRGTFRVVHGDGTVRAVLSRGRMLRRKGDPPVMSGVAIDVTDTVHAAERATRLYEATAAMAAAHTPADVARALATAVSDSLPTAQVRTTLLATLDASRARLDLVDDDPLDHGDPLDRGNPLGPGAPLGQGTVTACASMPLQARTPLTQAVLSAGPARALGREELEAAFPEVSEGMLAVGHTGVLALPLRVRGTVTGAMAVHFSDHAVLTRGDEQFLSTVASQCAQALDRAVRVEHEHEIAETLQQHLLPARLPDLPGISTAARYLPGTQGLQVGGDWYDLVDLGDGTVGVVIGDVVGKGLPAAMLMAEIRHGIRALLSVDPDPTAVLKACDRLAGHLLDDTGIITVFYGRLDLATGHLTYVSAGPPPPLLVPAVGACRFLPVDPQPPLGAAGPTEGRRSQHADLDPEDLLLLYTDGLVERRHQDLDVGLERLRAAAGLRRRSPHLLRFLLSRMLGPSRPDDVAVLSLRRDAAAPSSADAADVTTTPPSEEPVQTHPGYGH